MDDKGNVVKVAVYAKDITRQKHAEARVREREAALKIQKYELEELNTALKVLLKRVQQDKTELEARVLANVKALVMPYVEHLKNDHLNVQQKACLNRVKSNLERIVSPFAHTLSSNFVGLTPREIQVARLVKDGKTAKEIAELLFMSVRTVESHKKNIRKKVHINHTNKNLRSHLLSM